MLSFNVINAFAHFPGTKTDILFLEDNLYTPGSKTKIINSKIFLKKIKKFKIILILAWNFKDEILKEFRKYGFSGKVILPFPKKIKTKLL